MFSSQDAVYIALTDADGCIFNPTWQRLFLHVIAKYQQFFFKYRDSKKWSAEDEQVVAAKMKEIIAEVNAATRYVPGEKVELQGVPTYHNSVNSLFAAHSYQSTLGYTLDEIEVILSDIKERYRGFITKMGQPGKDLLNAMVYAANKPYFNEIVDRLIREKFSEFYLVCGSNRQSFGVDETNSIQYATGSFIEMLVAMQEEFNRLLSATDTELKCVLERMLLSDIYSECELGKSFNLILKELKSESGLLIEHPEYVFDKTKFSLIYAVAHEFAKRFPHKKLVIDLLDDVNGIHLALAQAIKAHPDLLPQNVTVTGWHYEGDSLKMTPGLARFSIDGTGPIDRNYAVNILKMAIHAGYDPDHHPSVDVANDCDFDAFKRDRILTKESDEVDDLAAAMSAGLTMFAAPENTEASVEQELGPEERVARNRVIGPQ